jgi:NAD(P)-dependent dehydrogenase (short-subunit alcohol dehydrogenase family)
MAAETTAPGRFRGHTAVVTGAARGIGATTAHRLAAEGARVVLTDVDDTGGQVAARIVTGVAPVDGGSSITKASG